jgi:hypothetical protein
MVAIIKTGSSITGILNYNENKVKNGVAECIGERNYPIDFDNLSFTMKLNRFLKQLALNDNVKRNSVHISLNFDPSETTLSKAKLVEIANEYMQKIGFGNQPYLIYRHYDAGHPHIHLVTIKIKENGNRIDMHNIGQNQSEKARKEIEESFGLVVAQGRKTVENFELIPIEINKVRYGKTQSKKAISNVLSEILPTYNYTCLTELNAVLLQYNVLADRGSEDSRIFKENGLIYRILDQNAKPIGVPIKASDFYFRPTLKFLESKFIANKSNQKSNPNRIKNAVDLALLRNNISLEGLVEILKKEGINTVFRKSAEGLIYGITYVDHKTKCVFNGSTLGKQYSAKAMQQRCLISDLFCKEKIDTIKRKAVGFKEPQAGKIAINDSFDKAKISDLTTRIQGLIEILTQPQEASNYITSAFGKAKKKRKRKGQSDNQ